MMLTASQLRRLIESLVLEEAGQDLIEYALLTGIISLGSLLVFDAIRTKMGSAYLQWGTEIQENWVPDPPITT